MTRAEEGVKTPNEIYKEIEGEEGLWKEQQDMVTKYMRQVAKSEDPDMKDDIGVADPMDISLSQFAKMYTPSRSAKYTPKSTENTDRNGQRADIDPEADNPDKEEITEGYLSEYYKENILNRYADEEDPDIKYEYLMWGKQDQEKSEQILPECIKIDDLSPGELPFMRRRRHPQVLRFNKSNKMNPCKYFIGEIMLYHPDWTEELFAKSDEEIIKNISGEPGSNKLCEETSNGISRKCGRSSSLC